jgi:hypothetical protein
VHNVAERESVSAQGAAFGIVTVGVHEMTDPGTTVVSWRVGNSRFVPVVFEGYRA